MLGGPSTGCKKWQPRKPSPSPAAVWRRGYGNQLTIRCPDGVFPAVSVSNLAPPRGRFVFLRLALASPADTWSLCSLQSRCLRLRRDPAKAAAASIRLVYSRVYSCIWPKCTFDPPVWTGGRPLSDGLSEVARCVVTISCTK